MYKRNFEMVKDMWPINELDRELASKNLCPKIPSVVSLWRPHTNDNLFSYPQVRGCRLLIKKLVNETTGS